MSTVEQTQPKKRPLSEIIDDLRKVLHLIDDLEGEVTPELEEELTACEADLTHKVDRCLWVAREAEAQAEVWSERAKAFADRAKVLKNQAIRLEDYVLWAMLAVNVDRLKTVNFTASVQNSPPSVAVENEEKFLEACIAESVTDCKYPHMLALCGMGSCLIDLDKPPKYVRIKVEVDKRALLAGLKEGKEEIKFARLVTDKVHLRVK